MLSVCGFKAELTQSDFQRPAVLESWAKQLLIDTILPWVRHQRNCIGENEQICRKYGVVDGQQQLRAILNFMRVSLLWPGMPMMSLVWLLPN